jgi:hypothetical protein
VNCAEASTGFAGAQWEKSLIWWAPTAWLTKRNWTGLAGKYQQMIAQPNGTN